MKRKLQQAQKLSILSFFKEATLETCIVNLLLKRKKKKQYYTVVLFPSCAQSRRCNTLVATTARRHGQVQLLINIRKLWLHPIPQPAGISGEGVF